MVVARRFLFLRDAPFSFVLLGAIIVGCSFSHRRGEKVKTNVKSFAITTEED